MLLKSLAGNKTFTHESGRRRDDATDWLDEVGSFAAIADQVGLICATLMLPVIGNIDWLLLNVSIKNNNKSTGM